ncbi:hypothetical protein EZV62_000943 [Acer yangbiense]|uniref:Ubiquitin-like domain-containing protein n=1 Tax=Acer yangbiense TaxID=1000413 RepID=A0A5C7IV38_9ROSI|nr:hypothetical protein EZV62_000935 [Acer yangbiense]TXG72364.1 hypothetical protein EZV62_000943 [Acer yangbiense]
MTNSVSPDDGAAISDMMSSNSTSNQSAPPSSSPDQIRHDSRTESRNISLLISVRMQIGKIVTLEVRQSNTICSVKEKYFQQTDVHVNRQRLLFGGQMLKDNKDLAHYIIEDGFTLRELIR